jgi:soluble cytochrome b562
MSALSGPTNKLQPEWNDSHAGFFKAELALCFTLADVAEATFKIGHSESAESAMGKAQEGWATAQRLVSDPRHAKRLTDDEIQDITVGFERLRARIDGLMQLFKK